MLQDIFAQSVSQIYPIGMRLTKANRIFRYSQATQALEGLARLVINSNYAPGVTGHECEDGFEKTTGNTNLGAVIGQTYLDILDTVARVANFYQGGMVIIYGTTIFHQHYIVKSDVGDGSKVRLYLESPVAVEDIAITMGVTAYRSPYSAVKKAGSTQASFEPFIGLPLIPVTINNFFWLWTAGHGIVTPTGGTWPGSAANLRAVYVNPNDGTIQPATICDPSAGYQYIGDLVECTGGSGADYGDLLINLRLDPTM